MPWGELEDLLQSLALEPDVNININGESGSINLKGVLTKYVLNIPSPVNDGDLEISLESTSEVNYSIGANDD